MKKIKIEKLEKDILRKAIPYGDDVIVINELDIENRQKLIEEIVKSIENGGEMDIKSKTLELINICTNVEFDQDIFEVKNPTHEVKLIFDEVVLMLQEVISECYSLINLSLEKAKTELLEEKVLLITDELKEEVAKAKKTTKKSKKSNK